VVIHVSNFRPVKRAHLAVEAFARVVETVPATLVMVGDGPERAMCEARAAELGVRNRVRFLGAQTDIEHLLPNADLLLLPSEYESFGLAALEAMACGVVPVATRAGGLPEVIEDGVDGVLVDPDDMASMGALAIDLLRDEERRAALSIAARRSATERFARSDIIMRYEDVYRSVLQGQPV